MNRRRYEGYVAVREAMAEESLEGQAADLLGDLAEGLLLARGLAEAKDVRDQIPDALSDLVDRGDLTWFAAHRFWVRIRACGPALHWPASWRHGPRFQSRAA